MKRKLVFCVDVSDPCFNPERVFRKIIKRVWSEWGSVHWSSNGGLVGQPFKRWLKDGFLIEGDLINILIITKDETKILLSFFIQAGWLWSSKVR